MPASELKKKAIFFLFIAVILSLALILLPLITPTLENYVASVFGSNDSMMGETATALFKNILRIIKVIIWMTLVVSIIRFLDFLIFNAALRGSSQNEISSLLRNVFSIIIYIVAFFIIFQSQYPTIELAALFTGSAILGIVVGLALQDTLGNLFAGIALQADQPFVVGDVISLPNRGTGVVESVSWRGVRIRTFQNKLLVISNSVLGKESIEVAPKDNLNARIVNFSTVYSASPADTASLVREAMRQSENVSQKMRPVVRIRNLGDNGIEWEVKYWLENYSKYNDTDALVRERIWYAFQREKIEFPFPTRILHMQDKPVEIDAKVTVNMVTERLKRVPIFDPLSEEEMERLATACKSRVYAPGEAIVRLGGDGNSMFVINRGKVKVQIIDNDLPKVVNELAENDFFGEMSLLTGRPRTASVIAIVETEVLQIRKNSLKPILESNPILVQSITEIIDEREQMLLAAEESQEIDPQERKKGVIRSIRKFFGLRAKNKQDEV